MANVESVSSSLSAALSPPSPSLSTDEVEVVLDVLETLIFFPMASLNVSLPSPISLLKLS